MLIPCSLIHVIPSITPTSEKVISILLKRPPSLLPQSYLSCPEES